MCMFLLAVGLPVKSQRVHASKQAIRLGGLRRHSRWRVTIAVGVSANILCNERRAAKQTFDTIRCSCKKVAYGYSIYVSTRGMTKECPVLSWFIIIGSQTWKGLSRMLVYYIRRVWSSRYRRYCNCNWRSISCKVIERVGKWRSRK